MPLPFPREESEWKWRYLPFDNDMHARIFDAPRGIPNRDASAGDLELDTSARTTAPAKPSDGTPHEMTKLVKRDTFVPTGLKPDVSGMDEAIARVKPVVLEARENVRAAIRSMPPAAVGACTVAVAVLGMRLGRYVLRSSRRC